MPEFSGLFPHLAGYTSMSYWREIQLLAIFPVFHIWDNRPALRDARRVIPQFAIICLIALSASVTAQAQQLNLTASDTPLPQTALMSDEGRAYSLADFKGTALVVNFWASWCAPCIKELPDLDRLDAELSARGGRVLLVSLDRGGADVAQAFLDNLQITHPVSVYDPQAEWARALSLRGLPVTLFIPSDQAGYQYYTGPADWMDPEIKGQLYEQLALN